MVETSGRTGAETRAAAQRIATELFIARGYDATSLREIAERLGISKASLYYHFPSKEAIVRSVLAGRTDEAASLLAWAAAQPPSPELATRVVLRWVESSSVDKLNGIRFATANPQVAGALGGSGALRDGLEAIVRIAAGPHASPARSLLVRMALLSINSAVAAARGTVCTDAEIVAASRAMAEALLAQLPA